MTHFFPVELPSHAFTTQKEEGSMMAPPPPREFWLVSLILILTPSIVTYAVNPNR